MTPVWSPDGKTLYFSSDRSGIFNIYAYDLAARTFAQVTNVRTGAFMPAVSADGKTLVYAGYTSYGHDLYTMPLDPARFLPRSRRAVERPDPATEPEDVPLRRHPYNPLPTVAPRSYLLNLAPGNYGAQRRLLHRQRRRRRRHPRRQRDASPSSPAPRRRRSRSTTRTAGLPVDFTLHFFYLRRAAERLPVDNQSVRYNETDVGVSAGVSYTHQEAYASHSLGLSFSVGEFQRGRVARRQRTTRTRRAQRARERQHQHRPRGLRLLQRRGQPRRVRSGPRLRASASGFDYASPYTGSSYTVRNVSAGMQGYLSMPWPGHQTLALRAAGAVSGGDYPRSGAYYVGGYDLADNSLPSTVLSGVFNGSFVLRGYPPGVVLGLGVRARQRRVPLPPGVRGPRHLHAAALPAPPRRQRLRRLRRRVRHARRARRSASSTHGALIDERPAPRVARRRALVRRHPRLPARYPATPRLRLRVQRRGGPRAGSRTSWRRAPSDEKLARRGRVGYAWADAPCPPHRLRPRASPLAGCVAPPTAAQRLSESAYDFNTAIRFGRMDIAPEHVREIAREEFGTASTRAGGSRSASSTSR